MDKEIINLIKKGNVVCFCGSGISAESGVDTFRGEKGLWARYDPVIFASADGLYNLFSKEPARLTAFVFEFYSALLNAKPNYAHQALYELEKQNILIGTITQNIDDFHYQAGNHNIAELHGNSYGLRCIKCGKFAKRDVDQVLSFLKDLENSRRKYQYKKAVLNFLGRCQYCKGRMRPGVVLFGQSLPQDEIEKAEDYINNASTLICVGTEGVVYPAASFPYYAKKQGAKVINVNIVDNSLDQIADYKVRSSAVDFFKELMPLIKVSSE